MIEPRFRWVLPAALEPPEALVAAGRTFGLGPRAIELLATRGVRTEEGLVAFLAPPAEGLLDPSLLPDAERFVERIARARATGERVLVFGDFDADGLTGLAIMISTLRRLGVAAEPYVPGRLEEGHGLSMAAVEAASRDRASLIVTVDTGSTSQTEVAAAAARGIDVIVTDHHRVPSIHPPAAAFVNPHRADSHYPDARLAGSGVAFKLAQLLLATVPDGAEAALGLADLAAIGTVADLAPVLGENRSIVRLGLERLRKDPRPGVAALLARARVAPSAADVETIAFALAPRLNAAGRVGEARDAAELLLADDPSTAADLAAVLEAANGTRRDLTRQAVNEAEIARTEAPDAPVTVVRGPWSVGIVGLVAARLVESTGRPAVVGADLGPVIRASCRSEAGFDLAAALEACSDLLLRHGGHPGAAGFEVATEHWSELRDRLVALVGSRSADDGRRPLAVDLALPARSVDYTLVEDLARLAPFGTGHPEPLVAVLGLTVTRVRPANGGHTQLVLRRDPDVIDGIAFDRPDLAEILREGDRIDVVARLASRAFGGFESLRLEVRDVASSGTLASDAAHRAASLTGPDPERPSPPTSRVPEGAAR